MKRIVFFIVLLTNFSLNAQEKTVITEYENLTIEWDNDIQELVEEKLAENCNDNPPPPPVLNEYCNGNRIQLFYTKDRTEAEIRLKEAKSIYPGEKVNLDFVSPEYKIKLGYFSSRESANEKLTEIRRVFKTALITEEKVRCFLIN